MPFSINPSFTKVYHHDPYPTIDPARPELSLAGQKVLVTGGGRGIGRAIAFAFAAAGASTIVLVGRTEASLLVTKSDLEKQHPHLSVKVYVLDIADHDEVKRGFQYMQQHLQTVDVLVSNAGYLPSLEKGIDELLKEKSKSGPPTSEIKNQ